MARNNGSDAGRLTGVIKKKLPEGFGFITESGTGTQRFFHRSMMRAHDSDGTPIDPAAAFDALREGEQVSFDPFEHAKGPRALDVAPGE